MRLRATKTLLWLLVGLGVVVGVLRLLHGPGSVTALTDLIPWGLWKGGGVVALVALGGAGFTLAMLVYVFHRDRYRPAVRGAVLLALLAYSSVGLGLTIDIGIPWRIVFPVWHWQVHSVLFEVAWCIMLYLGVLAFEFGHTVLERLAWPRALAVLHKGTILLVIAGISLSTLHQSSLGTLFLATPFRLHPLWHTDLLPLLFFVSSMAVGCLSICLVTLVVHWLHHAEPPMEAISGLGRLAAWLLGAYLVVRFTELANEGARGLGYADLGAQWRSGYDMDAAALRAEVERLWEQVRPLYEQLHCHVRARLADLYGEDLVPAGKPIPAHLLGNMWSQSWENTFPLVAPYPKSPGLDVGPALKERGATPEQMVRMGEAFFTSIGFDPLPQSFFERSMLTRPEGKEVSCHASAWDVGFNDDLRISMCIQPTMEDLITIHHELGHCYYYHAYFKLPMVYQTGAHDGFHEAIGDSLALSVTPEYLRTLGLLDKVTADEQGRLNRQMHDGLSKIAFLPFALVVDGWRWDVFGGAAAPDSYNAAWWELRRRYQGIEPPVARGEEHFDPGAKYHVASHVPYLRYFLAHILQFQFHRALCKAAGHEGPLDRCSIYKSEDAGKKLRAMLALGASRPWPDALEAMTGERRMDAAALLDYFAPLSAWLEKENAGRTCGW